MADNVGITPGAGVTIAADDVGGILYQVMKLAIGGDGVASFVSAGSPLPVSAPASLRTTHHLGAATMVDAVMTGYVESTPKFAKANIAASQTDANIVTAVGGKSILVLLFRLHAGGTATTVVFNSKPAGAGTAISEVFAMPINGNHSPGFSPVGHFKTTSGEGLTVTTGAGSTTGIGVVYAEV
jgi:hypothetical protein